jgi:hypothetical protein
MSAEEDEREGAAELRTRTIDRLLDQLPAGVFAFTPRGTVGSALARLLYSAPAVQREAAERLDRPLHVRAYRRLQMELERDMKLMRCTAIGQLSRDNLRF